MSAAAHNGSSMLAGKTPRKIDLFETAPTIAQIPVVTISTDGFTYCR